jgi:hypothetical protein
VEAENMAQQLAGLKNYFSIINEPRNNSQTIAEFLFSFSLLISVFLRETMARCFSQKKTIPEEEKSCFQWCPIYLPYPSPFSL